MIIHHLAIWVRDLEKMKRFYTECLGGKAGSLYHNPHKRFTSYFISFREGARIELMHCPALSETPGIFPGPAPGWAHCAFLLKNKDEVDHLTRSLKEQKVKIAGEPRMTGDGYYESVVLDPEGNRIELLSIP